MKLAPVRDAMSETMWKWQYKVRHGMGATSDSKMLADYDSSETVAAAAAAMETAKNADLGSSPSIKTMFEGPKSTPGHFDWVDYPPKQLSKSAAKAQDRVAIKVFKVKDGEKPVIQGKHSLRYHSIEVQNPLLVGVLAKILSEKQDVHLDAQENATFKFPFRGLYFGYEDIRTEYRDLKEEEPVKPFMLLLLRLLDDVFAETRVKVANMLASNLVSFKFAWTFFPRGSTVISWGNNCELLCKVSDTAYKVDKSGECLAVVGKVLRFTGRGFQWEDIELEINRFAGNKPITDLDVYPIRYAEKPEEIMGNCAERGRKVLDYQGLAYVNYNGIVIHRGDQGCSKHNVDGRVLIDVVGFNRHHLKQGAREGADRKMLVDGGENEHHEEGGGALVDKNATTSSKAKRVTRRLSEKAQERVKKIMLTEHADSLMFVHPLIEGYALKNKLWVSFFIEDISPLTWNDAAYEHLVYDEQQKDLVMSFVENHQHLTAPTYTGNTTTALVDVIAGKGEGLIILLSGPPGTGKTLMAEAVADRTHRPLYYLQAEDLGTNAAVLGANVKKVFEMATEWDAVILLDEADVFMAERHPQDIARNELVSIFLRELEYFRGIIFLTTNLYSTIDQAFRSRVSLHLLFNPLSPDARLIVWRKFLERLAPVPVPAEESKRITDGSVAEEEEVASPEEEAINTKGVTSTTGDLTEDDLKDLAAWNLNGREIKTAVKMVRSWCDYKGYEMTLSRLESGIKVTSPHATKSAGVHEHDSSLYDD
ncbi:hypothetical protein B0H66DRAFT_480710 [Apodospora peruviana]|uniref:AAA+ ATPase domain-containing protein n=1 Tax=Apodospora peruviana TaxID=516989 RepID=A0AAE0M1B9_9PEZI|nr:hypothetical protein B0H66DRAFT_480710 [Apodospora peruviana]